MSTHPAGLGEPLVTTWRPNSAVPRDGITVCAVRVMCPFIDVPRPRFCEGRKGGDLSLRLKADLVEVLSCASIDVDHAAGGHDTGDFVCSNGRIDRVCPIGKDDAVEQIIRVGKGSVTRSIAESGDLPARLLPNENCTLPLQVVRFTHE